MIVEAALSDGDRAGRQPPPNPRPVAGGIVARGIMGVHAGREIHQPGVAAGECAGAPRPLHVDSPMQTIPMAPAATAA